MEPSSVIGPLNQVSPELLTGNRLESKIRVAQNATGEKQREEIKKVSREFEAIFIAQLLKVMRETIEESGLTEGGFGKSIYTELFDQEVSLSIAKRGALGLSDLLYKNLIEKSSGANRNSANEARDTGGTDSGGVAPAPAAGGTEDISDLQLPVSAPVSSGFGMRKDPFTHQARFHKGLDLSAPEGTTVISALAGKIVSAGYQAGYGNTVLIQHADGLQTRYGHLGSIHVRPGQTVSSEAAIGTVGSTGRSTGPHLHFEVIRMGKPVDPMRETGTQVMTMQRSSSPKMGG